MNPKYKLEFKRIIMKMPMVKMLMIKSKILFAICHLVVNGLQSRLLLNKGSFLSTASIAVTSFSNLWSLCREVLDAHEVTNSADNLVIYGGCTDKKQVLPSVRS
uniref:Uncharacterized protein n=1 Tax=Zea mays TaxID=4577 RepID=B6U8Q3_MAIZE|nr:hypothetical protein [Zea mays]